MSTNSDPLMAAQKRLLAQIAERPLELTTAEANAHPANIVLLAKAGFLKVEHVHVAEKIADHRWRYTRTSKPAV